MTYAKVAANQERAARAYEVARETYEMGHPDASWWQEFAAVTARLTRDWMLSEARSK